MRIRKRGRGSSDPLRAVDRSKKKKTGGKKSRFSDKCVRFSGAGEGHGGLMGVEKRVFERTDVIGGGGGGRWEGVW